ncbi:MAG: hypothetical protein RLZZ50_1850, partial [Verrucomicrobiota bacterium]
MKTPHLFRPALLVAACALLVACGKNTDTAAPAAPDAPKQIRI